ALYCFDYSLTLAREVERIWKLGFSVSAVIFYCVRYSALVNTIFVILDQTSWRGLSDTVLFSALRAYALSWQDVRLLIAVLVFGSIHPAIVLVRSSFMHSSVCACCQGSSH
ncbi:hypothetical protein OH77DRAFT_1402140, partial [Trametes cingulata]